MLYRQRDTSITLVLTKDSRAGAPDTIRDKEYEKIRMYIPPEVYIKMLWLYNTIIFINRNYLCIFVEKFSFPALSRAQTAQIRKYDLVSHNGNSS